MKILITFLTMLVLSQPVLAGDDVISFNAGSFDLSHSDCQGDCAQDFDSSGSSLGISLEWYTAQLKAVQLGLNFSVITSINAPYYSRLSASVLVKKSIGRFPVFAGIGILDASSTIDEGSGVGATFWREHYQLPFAVVGIDYPMQHSRIRLSGTTLSGSASATGTEIIGFDINGNPILGSLSRTSTVRTSTIMIGFVLSM